MTEEKFDAKFDSWKNNLLDLSKRNKLLNYRETKSSTLKIVYPGYEYLYNLFVKKEKQIAFPRETPENSQTDSTLLISAADSNESESQNDRGNIFYNIKTNRNPSDLNRVLRNLRGKAKVAVEEQGINILYLSFGYLQYTEAEHSKYTYLSPLVLVPVTLTIDSITSPYIMKLHEDEIVFNPTLTYMLDHTYSIKMPEFDSACSISDFFDDVEKAVKDNGWLVVRDVGLSLLSFLKINMYDDLENHKEVFSSNPIVRALAGDKKALQRIPSELSGYDFDKNDKPENVFQIVDADASQQEAILYAKSGVSFILQGPPGTGKSQTITNIIAECLAEGKKVLFVSEKMAALEVVHRRISLAELDDFCLVLHSQKTSKKSVLEQLDKVLTMAGKKATMNDSAFQKLSDLKYDRDQLNNYAEQIYTVIKPLEKNIYEVNGILANLEDYRDVIFEIKNIREIDREQYIRFIQLLELYGDSLGKMTDGYKSNPWRGCHLKTLTNEFRRNTIARIDSYLPDLMETAKRVDEIYKKIFSPYETSLNGIKRAIKSLEGLEKAVEVPFEWVIGDMAPSNEEIKEYVVKQIEINEIIAAILKASDILSKNGVIEQTTKSALYNTEHITEALQKISAIIENGEPFAKWSEDSFATIVSLFTAAKETSDRMNELKDSLSADYEDSIYGIDYEGILARFKTEYTNFFKVFKSSYKSDKKDFLLCRKDIRHKISDNEIITTVSALKEIKTLENWFSDHRLELNDYFGDKITANAGAFDFIGTNLSYYSSLTELRKHYISLREKLTDYNKNESLLEDRYQFLYNGILTDWNAVSNARSWAETFCESVCSNIPSRIFVQNVCSSSEYAADCSKLREELSDIDVRINSELSWFTELFDDPTVFSELSLADLYGRLKDCINSMALLEEWIDFNTARKNCFEGGLGEAVTALENEEIPLKDIVPTFQKRFFNLWLDAVLPEYPAVLNFRRKTHEKTIERFSELDKSQFEIARARIKSKLINDLPSMDHFSSGQDEISILKRELSKSRRIMPIRKLFKEIPNLLLRLKPCLMMSPLSVSLFLEADAYKFDTVIFDEASQVYTENAIGAISRGKQVIIAGDSKQLPPTNFFQTTAAEDLYDDEDDEDSDIGVYDSILDEANMLPERTLNWHYRSRHESLIAFSNAKIYKNRLITFPSNIERGKDNGVEYFYVEGGYYDRGGRKGNVIEARKVAEMVFDHFKTQPNRSLGVIAFGQIQQYAIENILLEMRKADQSFESFFDETKDEAFFVKSLENVQGDERDTIIFSIGYAKDAAGVFRNQFGPLGKSGGERRLNVAITRAKYNVKLVGSILPTDINDEAVSSEGPKLLKAYIDYAINGPDSLIRELTIDDQPEFDSTFEEAVYNYLDRKGYKLTTQVGCSGYRIDIGVKHPTLNGVYVLGVECDGAAYHSAKTARERDRLRQDVLENMGWKIYRIWSADWIKDPVTEGELLIKAIDNAIEQYGADQLYTVPETSDIGDYIEVDDSVKSQEELDNRYGFEKYIKTTISIVKNECKSRVTMEVFTRKLIEREFPIHYDYLCQRLAAFCGNEKATVKVRREVDDVLYDLRGKVIRKGDYLYPSGNNPIVVKMPNERKSQYISPDEFAVAMLRILNTYVGGIKRKALCDETARVYGFRSIRATLAGSLDKAVDILLKTGKIVETEEKLMIKQ